MATADSNTSMPVRKIGQNPSTEWDRRARETARFEACLFIRATPYPHSWNQRAFTLHLRTFCVSGGVARLRTTLKILCQMAVFSYALTRLSSKQSSCDAHDGLQDAMAGFAV